MEESVIESLLESPLFQGFTEEELRKILQNSNTSVREYRKGSIIFTQGQRPEQIYILIRGAVGVSKNTFSGKKIMITKIGMPGETFGEIYLFLEKQEYEVQAQAMEKSVVLELKNELFCTGSGCEDPMETRVRDNLMRIFARKAYRLNNKVRVLGCASIREKIAVFLTEHQGKDGQIRANLSREEMADYLNVTRPSLSRELSNMVKEGILQMEGRKLMVLDQETLEEYL